MTGSPGGRPAPRRRVGRAVAAALGSVVVIGALAGCGGPGERAPAASPSASASPSPSSPSTPTPGTVGPGTVTPGTVTPVRYVRSGGLAGMDDVLVVSSDGTVTLTSGRPALRRTGRLTAAERSALAAAVAVARARDGVRRLGDPHPDAFVYAVTFDTSEYRFTGSAVPPGLIPLVRTLREVAGRLGRTF
jgi:hypothetical protein